MLHTLQTGIRVRVTDASHDPGLYQKGWEGTLLGCGRALNSPISKCLNARVGVRFDPGLLPDAAHRRHGNQDLGDNGGNATTGFRWHVPKDCLELAGPVDYTQYDEGGVV